MIQRVQTIYMLVVFLIAPLFLYFFENYRDVALVGIIGTFLTVTLTLISIFSYKKRKRQLILNNLTIIINLLLIGFLVFYLLKSPGGFSIPEKGVELLIPLLNCVFLVIANKYINKDEKLVKSVDRLR
ncbi:MAG: DUF4293 family protein [Flavobacteriales bacterium]|nr:DUF4293 family protein [Flavobacteriales bacterium]